MKKLVVVLCGLLLSTFAIAQEHGGQPVGEEPADEAVGQQKAEEHAGQPVGKEQAIKKGKGKKKGLHKEHQRRKPQRHPKAQKSGRSKRR